MENSNVAKRRKSIANLILAEIATINLELENLPIQLDGLNYKELKKLNVDTLVNLRKEIQNTIASIRRLHEHYENIQRPFTLGTHESVEIDIDEDKVKVFKTRLIRDILDKT